MSYISMSPQRKQTKSPNHHATCHAIFLYDDRREKITDGGRASGHRLAFELYGRAVISPRPAKFLVVREPCVTCIKYADVSGQYEVGEFYRGTANLTGEGRVISGKLANNIIKLMSSAAWRLDHCKNV